MYFSFRSSSQDPLCVRSGPHHRPQGQPRRPQLLSHRTPKAADSLGEEGEWCHEEAPENDFAELVLTTALFAGSLYARQRQDDNKADNKSFSPSLPTPTFSYLLAVRNFFPCEGQLAMGFTQTTAVR